MSCCTLSKIRPILSCHDIIFHILLKVRSGTDCNDAGKTSTAILDLSDVKFRGRDLSEKVISTGRKGRHDES